MALDTSEKIASMSVWHLQNALVSRWKSHPQNPLVNYFVQIFIPEGDH